MLMLADNVLNQPWMILLLIIVFFGLIVLAIILVKRFVINKNKKVEPRPEEEVREEELNRILEPITDEESLKAMEEADKK